MVRTFRTISGAIFLLLFLFAEISMAQYKPGTYKGTSVGRSDKHHSGEIEVEVTVSETGIKSIKILKYEQSIDHKKYGKPVSEAKEKLPAEIVKKQSVDVDVIAKATMASIGIELAVARALEKASVKKYKPGTYKGSAKGRSDKHVTGEIEVEVKVSANAIEDIKVVKYDQSVNHKRYGKGVNKAKEQVPADIIKKQSLDVDGVAKATMASSGIELAVAKALEKARVK